MTNFLNHQLTTEWQAVRRKAAHSLHQKAGRVNDWLQSHWFRLLLIALLTLILLKKDLTLQLSLKSSLPLPAGQAAAPFEEDASPLPANEPTGPELTAPADRQQAYVERYAELARREMAGSGIPASIKLGQALLETNAGQSELATRFSNHFGIKCFSKECRRGHCSNYSDDSHKDFFRIYSSAEESFRSHSLLLQSQRYRHLFNLSPTDYQAWARGLQQAGYATDRQYAEKLIHLIENLQLNRFDS